MPSEHDPSARIGQILGKKYALRRLIGQGGMGVVFEVEHVFTKRIGALKLLQPNYAAIPEVVERFIREASAAGRIGNPHIVETIDAGELPSGEPYIFMELLAGSSVRDLIRGRGRLDFEEAKQIVQQAAEGLAAAHASGIVHRDIKPDNLFLCASEVPFVKILDFGISKFTFQHGGQHRLTAAGAPMGTPYYMSPEQVVAKADVDARVDIYSLGVVLYECLAGTVPFDAATLPALSIKIFEGRYTPLSRLVPDTPVGMDAVIARALAVDPERRFRDMPAFQEALAAVASGARVACAPACAPVRGANRTVTWSVGLAVFGLLGVGAAFAFRRPMTPESSAAGQPANGPPGQVEPFALGLANVAGAAVIAEESPAGSAHDVPAPSASRGTAVVRPSRAGAAVPAHAGDAGVLLGKGATRAAKDGLSEKNPFAD
jgi:eukaryotic-like serine/threonine-protein kinase